MPIQGRVGNRNSFVTTGRFTKFTDQSKILRGMVFGRNIQIAVTLMVLTGTINAQPYLISGNIQHAAPGKIYLASYYGDRFRITDSVETGSGSFLFILSEEDPAGIYRLISVSYTHLRAHET